MTETLNNNAEAPVAGDSENVEYPQFDKEAAEEAKQKRIAEYKAEYPDAVEDIEKAHFMAKSGDYMETLAEGFKKDAYDYIEKANNPSKREEGITRETYMNGATEAIGLAKKARDAAHEREDKAGELYDEIKDI